MREDERLIKKVRRVEDRERLLRKLKKEKHKMGSSDTHEIRKVIRVLREEMGESEK